MTKEELVSRIREFAAEKSIDDLVAMELGCYVYGLYAGGAEYPFYIGKGVGSRVLHHFYEVLDVLTRLGEETQESRKLISILESFADGVAKPEIRIIRRGLDEVQALAVEGALIDVLQPVGNKVRGIDSLKNGAISLDELNIEKGAKPLFSEGDYPMIYVFNIENGYRDRKSLDFALRGHWKWRKPMEEVPEIRARGGKVYAVGLIRGVSRHVIEIEAWVPSNFGKERFQMLGPAVMENDLLHRRWHRIIESGSWKYGTGMILEIGKENGVPGFRIVMGSKIKTFQAFA